MIFDRQTTRWGNQSLLIALEVFLRGEEITSGVCGLSGQVGWEGMPTFRYNVFLFLSLHEMNHIHHHLWNFHSCHIFMCYFPWYPRHSESMILRCWQKRQKLGACEAPDEVMKWWNGLFHVQWISMMVIKPLKSSNLKLAICWWFFSRGSTSFDPVAWRCNGEWMSSDNNRYDILIYCTVSLYHLNGYFWHQLVQHFAHQTDHWESIVIWRKLF